MAILNIFSIELLVFVGTLYTIIKINKVTQFTLKIAEGLITFCPPTDKDFEFLEKTD
jgi:hypothetical protein